MERLTNAAEPAGLDNLVELLLDELGGVPGPEVAGGGVPVPLAALVLVGLAAGQHGRALEERHGSRLARVLAARVLQLHRRAPDRRRALPRRLEELGVEGEAQVHLGRVHPQRDVFVHRGERALDRGVVVGGCVSSTRFVSPLPTSYLFKSILEGRFYLFIRSYVMTLITSTASLILGTCSGVKAIMSISLPGTAMESSLSPIAVFISCNIKA